jgi:hypothetical protein
MCPIYNSRQHSAVCQDIDAKMPFSLGLLPVASGEMGAKAVPIAKDVGGRVAIGTVAPC